MSAFGGKADSDQPPLTNPDFMNTRPKHTMVVFLQRARAYCSPQLLICSQLISDRTSLETRDHVERAMANNSRVTLGYEARRVRSLHISGFRQPTRNSAAPAYGMFAFSRLSPHANVRRKASAKSGERMPRFFMSAFDRPLNHNSSLRRAQFSREAAASPTLTPRTGRRRPQRPGQ